VPGHPPQAPGLPQQYGPPPGYPRPVHPAPGYPPPGYPASYPAGYPAYGNRPPTAPVPLSPTGQPLASFGDRLLAYLIDSAILFGAILVLTVPLCLAFVFAVLPGVLESAGNDTYDEADAFALIVPLLIFVGVLVLLLLGVQYLYYVEYMKRTGQTVGKKAMKIRVVRLDDGGPIDRGIAARRFLVQIVAGAFVPFFSYLDGLWQLWDKPFQQCLHDKFAKTAVVKVVT
jgi:uncharacterized RDD family membrane protein YckC